MQQINKNQNWPNLYGTPLLILPEYIPQLQPLPAEQRQQVRAQLQQRQRSMSRSGVGVVSLFGPISPEGEYGGTSLLQFALDFQSAVEDPHVGTVIIVIDSPGGTYAMTPET